MVYETNAGISPPEGPMATTPASSAIALCRRLKLSFRVRVCARVCTRRDSVPHWSPFSPRSIPKSASPRLATLLLPLLPSSTRAPRPPTTRSPFTLPYCKFHGPCIKLWSCPGIDPTQPAHPPSGYAARAHIRYVHF